mmetsp:Transcript_123411/g.245684  ORF Transcript_123411/g.245684 Transcript_123411/m.245684 type:complete len:243 (+) Transcript_123411:466-1194(+)
MLKKPASFSASWHGTAEQCAGGRRRLALAGTLKPLGLAVALTLALPTTGAAYARADGGRLSTRGAIFSISAHWSLWQAYRICRALCTRGRQLPFRSAGFCCGLWSFGCCVVLPLFSTQWFCLWVPVDAELNRRRGVFAAAGAAPEYFFEELGAIIAQAASPKLTSATKGGSASKGDGSTTRGNLNFTLVGCPTPTPSCSSSKKAPSSKCSKNAVNCWLWSSSQGLDEAALTPLALMVHKVCQ